MTMTHGLLSNEKQPTATIKLHFNFHTTEKHYIVNGTCPNTHTHTTTHTHTNTHTQTHTHTTHTHTHTHTHTPFRLSDLDLSAGDRTPQSWLMLLLLLCHFRYKTWYKIWVFV